MKLSKLFAVLVLSVSTNAFADIAVIVNSSNTNVLTDKDISRAYLGKLKAFADGQAIKAINSPEKSTTRAEFEQKVLKKSSSQVKAYWSKLIFTGKGKPPMELKSDAEIIKLVASTPNALGYVDAAALDGSVKVLKQF